MGRSRLTRSYGCHARKAFYLLHRIRYIGTVPPPNHWVVTAKFTEAGSNAWRRADGTWSTKLGEAALHGDEASAKSVLPSIVATEQRHISDPYVIEVAAGNGTITALS